jgi:hypothetical protein
VFWEPARGCGTAFIGGEETPRGVGPRPRTGASDGFGVGSGPQSVSDSRSGMMGGARPSVTAAGRPRGWAGSWAETVVRAA